MEKVLSIINKKIHFMAGIICLVSPSFSYAQNDLIATQTSPTTGQIIKSGVQFNVGLSIKNNSGPALTGSEIFVLTCYVDNGTKKDTLACATFTGSFVPIPAGATVGPFSVPCTYNFTTAGNAQVCQSVYIQGATDPSPANNVSCSAVTLQTSGSGCSSPASANITNITSTGATANWTAVTGATGYQVAVNVSATAPSSGQDVTGTSIPVTGLSKNTKYYFHVRTKCGSTFSTWQSSTTFTTLNQTAINTITNNQLSISVNPNPATDHVVFSTENKIEGKLLLSDLNGKVLISQLINGNETSISIAEIANGLYIYRLIDNRNVELNTGKLTILH